MDTRASDDHNSLHDAPKDDLALQVEMEKHDQLFNLYQILINNIHEFEFVLQRHILIVGNLNSILILREEVLQELVSNSSLRASWASLIINKYTLK